MEIEPKEEIAEIEESLIQFGKINSKIMFLIIIILSNLNC